MKDAGMEFSQKIRSRIPNNIKARLQRILSGVAAVPLDVERAEETFYIKYLREGMTVFDVGANIGEMTLLFSRFVGQHGRVFSFEAASDTYKKLGTVTGFTRRDNLVLNHLAMSDKVGLVKLTVYPDEYAGWNSLADRPLASYGIDVKPVRFEEIASSTVDVFCAENNISNIDLLKIDVEGAEYQVLLGAQNMLREKRIGCCVFEFGSTTFDMGNTPEMIESFLKQVGYKIRNIVPGNKVFPGRKSAKSAQFSIHIAEPK